MRRTRLLSAACIWGAAQGAWRGRQNAAAALDVVDNFFSAVLSSTLSHDLQASALLSHYPGAPCISHQTKGICMQQAGGPAR